MQTVESYTVAATRDGGRSVLVRRGGSGPGVVVDGLVLEAQFALPGGGALVWLTDDSPYEEGLHVYLLGADDDVIDAIEAGAAWAAGILQFRRTGGTWAEFEFFRNARVYRLEVAPTPGLRLRLPQGWRYKTLLRTHYLVVHELTDGG